jgi:oxygen-dependent protoporphyrinogen oxidase
LPQFVELERKYGSVVRGLWRKKEASHGARYAMFFNFKRGTQTLVDALARRVPVRYGEPVERLEGGWHVNGEKFDAVIVALPAGPAAALLRGVAPLLARELEGIPYTGAVTVNLMYPGDVLGKRSGYGFVVPAVERMALVACTFSHLKWPGRAERGSLLRAYLGGAFDPGAVALKDDELLLRVRRDLERLLGIREAPEAWVVGRLPASMPVYQVGHRQRVSRVLDALPGFPGLGLAGNALMGVGIPDVIARAKAEVQRLLS